MTYTQQQIADALDLAVLKPTATTDDVIAACELAAYYGIKSICVASSLVPRVRATGETACAVIGFPHGNMLPSAKRAEAVAAMKMGARELDVVVNYGRFLNGYLDYIPYELAGIVDSAKARGVVVKAILETCYYSPHQIRVACGRCIAAGVDFVKTSTGFGPAGATPEAVKIMIDAVRGTNVGVKASGGIKTYADAARYLDLGCTRIGASVYRELLP